MPEDAVTAALGGRAPKTRKGRRILEKRQPQVQEEAKTALILRGNKCSFDVQTFLRDLYRIRAPLGTLFMRKHAEHPFEDIKRVEQLCLKHDHTLFAFGSSSKKRPFRLILGRLFDKKLLDMLEFGVQDYKAMSSFKSTKQEPTLGSKPLLIFQGAAFESDERMKRAKSLLLDYFKGPTPEKVLLAGLEHVVVCTAFEMPATAPKTASELAEDSVGSPSPVILVERHRINLSKSGSKLPRVELEEIGPRFKLTLDRTRDPDRDRWKACIRVPKAAKPKKVKNVTTGAMGKKRGRIHLGKQDFDQIHTVHHSKTKAKKLKADLKDRKEGLEAAD